jgi:3-dehydroquinate dehydratase/shikimate dehydrogenase
LPVIVTCRDKAQGGAADLPSELRTRILIEALDGGADYIDCEFDNFVLGEIREKLTAALDARPDSRLILSAHNFSGPFDDPGAVWEEIAAAEPGAIPKVVYTANHINDCFGAFDLLMHKDPDRDAIVLCMGQAGVITRLLAKKLGGFVSFACCDADHATAPGQVAIEELKELYRWDSIDEKTELFGVIGSPVGHSLSPAIFNACFESQGINALYVPLAVDGAKEEFYAFINGVVARGGGGGTGGGLGFGGFSVTIPHKAHALDYVNHAGEFVEPLAENIGAVNTLKIGFGGIVSGYNTDYAGAMDALVGVLGIDRHELHSMKIAVVGAGGVARAVVAGLADVGAHVTVYNRTVSKAAALGDEFSCRHAGLDELGDMEAQVVINCTSIGMHPDVDDSPVPAECFREGMAVFDTVYNPLETKLLREAAAAGAKTVNGAEMFVRQAMAQYKIFIGAGADEGVIRDTVEKRLGSK